MPAPATLYDADTFPEFWDRYQELHADDESRVAHLIGTAAALGVLGLAIARRSWKLALAARPQRRGARRITDQLADEAALAPACRVAAAARDDPRVPPPRAHQAPLLPR
jgi:hypothetical protein